MARIARHVTFRARPGRVEELAERLLKAAELVRGAPGCELWVVGRPPEEPDAVTVMEIWRSREEADAALAGEDARALAAGTLELLDGRPEMRESAPVGGVGLAPALDEGAPYTLVALESVTDMAAKSGFGEQGSARFATGDLEARATGMALQRLNPGRRQAFGHRHERAEEVYVVLAGSGRVKLDDEVVELTASDALRVAPAVTRCFEAGPDGMELLAFGPRVAGDGELLMGWWAD